MITNDLFVFLEELSQHNNREWFTNNKKRYEAHVKKPLLLVAQELISEFSSVSSIFHQKPENCLFRVNRDVRFSKDKNPYKTHASVLIAPGGKKSIFPGFYAHIALDTCSLACGSYQLDKNNLFLVRNEILYQTDDWRNITQAPAFKNLWGELQGEKNKKLPPEFVSYADKIPELYHKSFYFTRELTRSEVLSTGFVGQVIDDFRTAWPLTKFLIQCLSEGYEK